MAVHGLLGNLGGGKTLSAVGFAVDHWCKGGTVVSNVSFHWDAVKEYCDRRRGCKLEDRQLKRLDHAQTAQFHLHSMRGTRNLPVLLIIDETARFFDAKTWNRDLAIKVELSAFLRESRKLHQEVFLIVQKEARLDKSFRELWEFKWTFRRLKWLPFLNRFIFQRQLHADTEIVVKSQWWLIDKEMYKLYDTDALYSNWTIADVPEVEPVDVGKEKKERSTMMRIFILVGILFAAWKIIGWVSTRVAGKPAPAKQTEQVIKKGETVVVSTLQPTLAPIVPAAVVDDSPKVHVEIFKGWNGGILQTTGGRYVPNGLCSKGRVMSATPTGAMVTRWDGVNDMVVAIEGNGPAPTGPMVFKWEPGGVSFPEIHPLADKKGREFRVTARLRVQ